ncbi:MULTISPECIES: hypothetical protein [unclassified Clostridium]|uniref:hypothetical protein n=1 Tax=Clostridium TaxID=1485 RepID=UPI001C8C38FD|nr:MULTISPECIES: hypothetical protein [unclassified Clostridium]MBX9138400.1 hypothetical protein [Clostridium sp. K12(2020)]MBX9145107.1 hypothetical protein [Clostridium sp. K13]MDU2290404.1 hypothetical protein [Clostridium celatum]MDU4326256.1 hypothetical protein [Clostridium celatum]
MSEDDKKIRNIKIQSTIAFIIVLLILAMLIGGIIFLKEFFIPSKELISRTESIDGKYDFREN